MLYQAPRIYKFKQMSIKITSEKIRQTEAFNKLTSAQQFFAVKRAGRLAIQNGLNIALNIGFDEYQKKTQSRFVTYSIVQELHESIKISN